jgi:hypothetical protein
MGIGFVLLFWLAGGIGAAVGISKALSKRIKKQRLDNPDSKHQLLKSIVATVSPYIFLLYIMYAFVEYWLWCEDTRNVDLGIMGDSWVIPLGEGYEMIMIDIPDEATIRRYHDNIVLDVVEIERTYPYLYGKEKSGYFTFDMSTGDLRNYKNIDLMKETLKINGVDTIKSLKSVNSFYNDIRWSYLDLIAAAIIFIPPGICALLIWWFLFGFGKRTSGAKYGHS